MTLQKQSKVDEPLYRAWVATLQSCLSGRPATVMHHAIGLGYGIMGGKASDVYGMPVDQIDHDRFHNESELKYDQLRFALETIEKAFDMGVIVFDKEALKRLSKREY